MVDVGQGELAGVLGEPEGLGHRLRARARGPARPQIHLPDQCCGQPVPGLHHRHHELQVAVVILGSEIPYNSVCHYVRISLNMNLCPTVRLILLDGRLLFLSHSI